MRSFGEWHKEGDLKNIRIHHTFFGSHYEIEGIDDDVDMVITFTDSTRKKIKKDIVGWINGKPVKCHAITEGDIKKGIKAITIEINFDASRELPTWHALGFP